MNMVFLFISILFMWTNKVARYMLKLEYIIIRVSSEMESLWEMLS